MTPTLAIAGRWFKHLFERRVVRKSFEQMFVEPLASFEHLL